MTSRRATQREAVLQWLRTGRTISVPEAERNLGVYRLAPRIHELRKAGYIILSIRDAEHPDGFVRYLLIGGDAA